MKMIEFKQISVGGIPVLLRRYPGFNVWFSSPASFLATLRRLQREGTESLEIEEFDEDDFNPMQTERRRIA